MKIVKAKVYYRRTAGKTTYREKNFDGYPKCWEHISPIGALWSNEFGVQEFKDATGTYQIWLLKVTDEDYDICMYDPQISMLSEADAEPIAADLDPDYDEPEEITNDAVVKRLTIKAMQGKPITKDEENMLDPDHPSKGIGRKKSFLKRHVISW